jgi:UPF0755 protein
MGRRGRVRDEGGPIDDDEWMIDDDVRVLDEEFDDYDDFAHDVEGVAPHQYEDDDHEYVPIRRRRQRSLFRRMFGWTLLLLVLGGLLAGLFGYRWVQRKLDPPGEPGEQVLVVVPEGASSAEIGEILADERIISDATFFRYYLRFRGAGPFQAGVYVLAENSSMQEAIDVLDAGPAPPPFVEFGMPEGLTLPEIADAIVEDLPMLSTERLMELINSGQLRSRYQPAEVTTLEGFLFPETYRLDEGADETLVLQTMINHFDTLGDQLLLNEGAARLGLTPYQVLTVASLVQEEAGIPEDSAMIARVIYNRLAQGIPLGVDATICYALDERPCELDEEDLAIDSPYNSRQVAGLPPTPIAAPGRAALEAALNPADGPWLYYVLDPNAEIEGGHFFTDDYDEFLRVKNECEAAGLGCG